MKGFRQINIMGWDANKVFTDAYLKPCLIRQRLPYEPLLHIPHSFLKQKGSIMTGICTHI